MSKLRVSDIAKYLEPLITSGARVFPGRLPDMPNRVIGISLASGPGFVLDGLFDAIGFQISCRGAENNFKDTEEIAAEVDEILTGVDPRVRAESFFIGSVYVDVMGRTGSGPTELPIPDSQSRYVFTCNYYAQAETGV